MGTWGAAVAPGAAGCSDLSVFSAFGLDVPVGLGLIVKLYADGMRTGPDGGGGDLPVHGVRTGRETHWQCL